MVNSQVVIGPVADRRRSETNTKAWTRAALLAEQNRCRLPPVKSGPSLCASFALDLAPANVEKGARPV